MRVYTRCLPFLCLLVLGLATLCQAQTADKGRPLPDFDIRDLAPVDTGSYPAKGTVERRGADIEAFLARERSSRPGLRIVPNRFGLPKVFLRDGGILSAPSTLAPDETARNFLRA